ncbi:MAG: hypothetical protein K8R53_16380, partial [Bacteroidales bacterium]|nr:hypothetical protein [Bacteroidales bacterium]
MITYDHALAIVLQNAWQSEYEEVDLQNLNGRVLAEDIFADLDMPPFHKSAVDGYACRRKDIHNDLKILEVIAAGKIPKFKTCKNECSKIMTGAPLPEGADAIFMVEDARELDTNHVKYTGAKLKNNVCYQGEDVKAGNIVLNKGTLIEP